MSKVIQASKKRRRVAIAWVVLMSIAVVVLMVTEQIALLYVLATLGVAGLLVIVALADLRGGQQRTSQLTPPPRDDAAAIGAGMRPSVVKER